MTSGQRKAHKYIWLVLIIVVPLTMFSSIKNLNIFSASRHMPTHLEGSHEISLKSYENDIVRVSVFESSIEVILKSTLKNSSAVVFEMDAKGNKLKAMGQLTTTGIYNFNTINLPKGIIIYDDLKQVEITKFSFQWD
ncbi:MAG: hypothetical protein ACI86M_003066 [Saprospiraceae bacterium]|jgi:hypothetical protein